MVRSIVFALVAVAPLAVHAEAFDFKPGDRICLIGNATADRMQHDGWLETYLQAMRPEHKLVFRNLGFTGDQIDHRPRSHKEFGSPDEHLTRCQASVIFAFFGYNESFDNKPDLFKAKLLEWIAQTKKKKYNGDGPPRIVLFSPIAHEDLGDRNLPDGHENNARLAAYTKAMKAAADEADIAFVDLFTPTLQLYPQVDEPLTVNGVHLNEEGNRRVAEIIAEALLGKKPPLAEVAYWANLQAGVLDKNWHWFNRYRATDGNDVWGGRSGLRFVDGQTNRDVLQHELKMIDVMTANRDERVWALANGRDIKIDDSNVPSPVEVKSNYRPSGKTGTKTFLSPSESMAKMHLAKGLKANIFASEQMFPEMANPVQMGVDTKGRVWVAAWPTYPKWEPLKEMNDALLILPDDDGDGVADRCITFAHVHNPTGFEFWNGGVIVISAPDILFLKDTDGDDKADVRIRLFGGIDSADTHHTANNLVYGPDGYVYYQRGVFHTSNVETPWQANQESGQTGMYRFNPRTAQFAFHAKNGPNPHGISFDYWGYHYATDGTGGQAYQVVPTGKGFKMQELLKKQVRPVPSSGILSSEHFPPEYEGRFLILNAIGFLGIKQYTLSYNNGNVRGEPMEDFLRSDDGNFRPTDFVIGDRGAMYVADWCNPLIGHMQHNIRDPMRDHEHGRIYRITAEGRPLAEPVKIDGEPIEKLLDLLKHPTNDVRHRVRVELSERDTKQVIAAARQWIKQFDPKSPDHAHHLLEALWLHQQHNVVDRELLKTLLDSPVDHARFAAKRVEQFWSGDPAAIAAAPVDDTEPKAPKTPVAELKRRGFTEKQLAMYEKGAEIFTREGHCGTCHQVDGKGLANLYPPLTDSVWAQGDETRLIKITLLGLWGELEVHGQTYNGNGVATPPMTGFAALLNDEELASVLTYVRNTFDNNARPIDPKTVANVRQQVAGRGHFFMVDEILKLHPLRDDELKQNRNPGPPASSPR